MLMYLWVYLCYFWDEVKFSSGACGFEQVGVCL